MLQQLSMVVRSLAVVASAAVGPFLPQPSQGLVLLVLGAAVLVPLIPWLAGSLVRALCPAPSGPSRVSHAVDALDVTVPAAPGTPGTALARAPSRRVRAFA